MFTWLEIVLMAAVAVLGLAWLYQIGAKIHWKIRARAAEIAVRGATEEVERANRMMENGWVLEDPVTPNIHRGPREPFPFYRDCSEWPEVLEEKEK
jgi:hypothetical protein